MRSIRKIFTALTATAALAVPAIAAPQHAQDHRGQAVMGFDQHKTTHRFSLYEDGGAIDVSVKDAGDHANRDAIRSHLPHIAQMFGAGNFDAPMLVHAQKVPGTAEMAKFKDRLTFKYVETGQGGRVDIVTTDPEALAAVHAFLRFQIADHKTGDTTRVSKRPQTTGKSGVTPPKAG
jgi:hypothetical protein